MARETINGGPGDQGRRPHAGRSRDFFDLSAQLNQPPALGDIAPDSPEALEALYRGTYTRQVVIDRLHDQRRLVLLGARWKYGGSRLTWGYHLRIDAERERNEALINFLAIDTIRKFNFNFDMGDKQAKNGRTRMLVGGTGDRRILTIDRVSERIFVRGESNDEITMNSLFTEKQRRKVSSIPNFQHTFLKTLADTIEEVNTSHARSTEVARGQEHKKRVISERMKFFDLTGDNISGSSVSREVEVCYDTSDPYVITFLFDPDNKDKNKQASYEVGRDLLRQGVEARRGEIAGFGNDTKLGTSIDDGMKTVLRFMSVKGPILFHANRAELAKFLRRTRKVVPYGLEPHFSGDVIKGLRIPDQP